MSDQRAASEAFQKPEVFSAMERPVIITAGRLEDYKGVDVLLNALASLKRDGLSCQLIVLGEGKARGYLDDLTCQLQLEDSVRFEGFVDNPLTYYRWADLFVLPSRREGFGNVLIEAMSVGVPVVATACIGPKSLFSQTKEQVLAPVNDSQGLAKVIRDVLQNGAKRERMIKEGLELADAFEVGSAVGAFQRHISELCT